MGHFYSSIQMMKTAIINLQRARKAQDFKDIRTSQESREFQETGSA